MGLESIALADLVLLGSLLGPGGVELDAMGFAALGFANVQDGTITTERIQYR